MATYTRQLATNGWPTTLEGTLGYTVLGADGTERIARTTAGVTHDGGGCYSASATFDTAWGQGRVLWDDGGTGVAVETFNAPAETPDGLLDHAHGVETGFTLRRVLRGMAAVLMGKSSAEGSVYRDLNDTKPRVTATLDDDENRTDVTRDLD